MTSLRSVLGRWVLLLLAGVVALGVTTPAGAKAADSSDRGGPITRSEVIWRAQYWVDQAPSYNQHGTAPGPGGDYDYRTDCSGYVSMAWHLDAAPNTQGLPGYSRPIGRDELRPGDVLNSFRDHVLIFHEWLDDQGGFSYYSFGGGSSGVEPPGHFRANINNASLDGHPNGDYQALRYLNITEESAARPHPYASGRVVSGRSADGRLESFAAGAEGVYHSWQTEVNGGWSAWRFEGGPRNAQLAVASNADGRLELFALSDSTLDHMWQTGPSAGWSGWANFGTGGYRLAAGNNADGRIEVFASNSTGVYHRWQTAPSGGWDEWKGIAGAPTTARLAMETSADGRLEVFALSDSVFGHLWQTEVNGGWSTWDKFGDGGHDLTVNHNTDGRLEVFASNSSGVFHRWQTGFATWSEWVGTDGPANAQLASDRTLDGRVEVFAINGSTAAHIWQTDPNAPYSAWANFGEGGTGISTGRNVDGRIEVFATNKTGVFHKWQTGFASWSQWGWVGDSAGPGIG
ncbi:M23 family peptidase [Streptomyces sp. ASQP_92]|uniref:M23 family peptidase n=1 Tax=Streptomyces sp. ASQP_92 TaxID=2979116 RepID=UPI0021C0793D|nr:M23 family peptidase [Streptomyces sp. ASQP_92]MCT9093229.1 M23 family peptidase [Streptomyces sp. ASQP_92]